MGPRETKKLSYIKGNNQKREDEAHGVEENLCWLDIYKRIKIQNIARTQKSKTQGNNRPHFKMSCGSEQRVDKRRNKITKKQPRKCSTILVIREMKIKTSLMFHLTPVRMANIKKTN